MNGVGPVEALARLGLKPLKGYSQWALANPEKRQEQLLGEILRRHASTTFGKKHGFTGIHSIRSFQAHCPVHGYEYIKPYVDAMLDGSVHVLSNSKLIALAHTTGTTGTPKLIPVTPEVVKTYNMALVRTTGYYIAEEPSRNAPVLRGKWLYLPAPAVLRHEGTTPVGYITGLLTLPSTAQPWRYLVSSKYYTTLHLAGISMSRQFDTITRECAGKDITMIVGTTPVAVNLLEHMTRASGVRLARELFPGLRFGIFSGVSPRYYEPRIEQVLGKHFTFREVYAASEGMLAAQLSSQPGMTPLHDDVFFEFIPVTNPVERLLLHEVKKGEEYRLAITSHNGLYAYDIGDVIRVIDVEPPRIEVVYRNNAMDIAGEKVTPPQVFSAIKAADEACRSKVVDFRVVGTYAPKARYVFAIEFDAKLQPSSLKEYLAVLDKELRRLNDVYQISRSKRILVEPDLWVLIPGTFHSLESEKVLLHGPTGQVKTSRLTNDARLLALLEEHALQRLELGSD